MHRTVRLLLITRNSALLCVEVYGPNKDQTFCVVGIARRFATCSHWTWLPYPKFITCSNVEFELLSWKCSIGANSFWHLYWEMIFDEQHEPKLLPHVPSSLGRTTEKSKCCTRTWFKYFWWISVSFIALYQFGCRWFLRITFDGWTS